jgi:hypothetical protein
VPLKAVPERTVSPSIKFSGLGTLEETPSAEGMSEILGTIVVIVGLFVGMPLGLLWLRDRIKDLRRRGCNPPEKVASDRRAYEERILHPDWEFYRHHLQQPVPPALRDLYTDRGFVIMEGLDYPGNQGISTFGALDDQGLLDTRSWLGLEAVAIATSDFGDPIYLRPGASQADTVYITHHDGGDTEVFAESVASMLEGLRHANRRGNWGSAGGDHRRSV